MMRRNRKDYFSEAKIQMRTIIVPSILAVIFFAATTVGQNSQTTHDDREAIKQTALDYMEGWYEGNAERMERSLHPDLAKRIVNTDSQGRSQLGQMSAMGLVQGVKRGGGKATQKDRQEKDVVIFDVFGNTASVKAVMSGWVDYLHMAKWNGRWVIINVLWEMKPEKKNN